MMIPFAPINCAFNARFVYEQTSILLVLIAMYVGFWRWSKFSILPHRESSRMIRSKLNVFPQGISPKFAQKQSIVLSGKSVTRGDVMTNVLMARDSNVVMTKILSIRFNNDYKITNYGTKNANSRFYEQNYQILSIFLMLIVCHLYSVKIYNYQPNSHDSIISNNKQMQQKQQRQTVEQQSLRYQLLRLLQTNVEVSYIPLHAIEVVFQFIPYLQVLKFSIDYFTTDWLGHEQPIFSFFDASYYLLFANSSTYQLLFLLSLLYMNLYWIVLVFFFTIDKELSNLGLNIKKFAFIVNRNLLLLPFFNLILNMYNCGSVVPFRQCYANYNVFIKTIAILSFVLFGSLVLAQSFFNFDFIKHKKQFRRIKRSSFMPLAITSYLLLNEALAYFLIDVTQLVVLDLTGALLLVLFWMKDEQVTEKMKLIQLSFLGTNLLAILMANILFFTDQDLSLFLFFFLSCFLAAGLMQVKTYSLKFELQNINKWTTSQVMIRYTNTLRYYLGRKDEYIFKVYIHGYMEMHRQKCDYPACPSRNQLTQQQRKLFEVGKLKKQDEQILRAEHLVKKIYLDGCKLTPISAELQLQYAIFLYEINEKELALKNLLLIKYQELSYDKYYRYSYIKQKIHKEMCEQPNKNFLDLVSELRVKREQDLILKKFQKAAFINLEFWSILNEDHPDFQKLNLVSANRIHIRRQVKQSYRNICEIAHSQKITSLYVQYLQSIQNDEDMYNEIYQTVKDQYDLEKKIVLQDWANSSSAIMLVGIDQLNHGSIIDINSSCASLFGYERYEILNRPLKLLFTDQLKDAIKGFLCPNNNEEHFFMTHKSGYLLKMKRICQNYNSMETGMASIIALNIQIAPNQCYFALDSSQRVCGVSSSIISLIGLEMKAFEGDVYAKDFFNFPITKSNLGEEQKSHKLQTLLKQQYQSWTIDYGARAFKVLCDQKPTYTIVTFEHIFPTKAIKNRRKNIVAPNPFEFQVQATTTYFKYFGSFNDHQTYVSQFSQLQYAESLKQGNTVRDYSQGISTLRLRDNIIQVIEQLDQQQIQKYLIKNGDIASEYESMARKDEEAIFQSKNSYEDFISRFTFAKFVNFILLASMAGLLSLYITYHFLYSSHYSSVQSLTSEIAFQNLIIGSIAKQLSLLKDLELLADGMSPQTVARFTKIYSDNINYLQSIKLMGASPYQISVSLGSVNQTFLTDQFLLSYINYAVSIYSNMSQAKTTADLVATFRSASATTLQYLLTNSQQIKQVMMEAAAARQLRIAQQINNYMSVEILMFVGGLLFVALFAAIMFFVIHKINKERINIFQIFLDISEIQIQQFSSKTQKFLLSLHVEDTNGQIDVDEQVQNTKKINNSTFAKKKRFKLINLNKSIYIKLSLIPIIAIAYFVHSFAASYTNLLFQSQSYHYFFLTSQGDYNFYSGLSQIQTALINNSTIPNSLSEKYIGYYRKYFDKHFKSFGYINDFHYTFTNVFMLDTCKGLPTAYGSTQIKQSCQIPLLSINGSYLVFTDTAMNTEFFTNSSSLTYNYLVGYEVLSKTHRLLTQNLIKAQQNLINQTMEGLLGVLLIWVLIMSAFSFLYGAPVMKRFIDQINEIKNVLSILPISVAKELPLAPKYFNKIIKSSRCC